MDGASIPERPQVCSILAREQLEEPPARVQADHHRVVQDEREPHPPELGGPLARPAVALYDPAVAAEADNPSLHEVRDQERPVRRVDHEGKRVPQIGLFRLLEEDVAHGNDQGPRSLPAPAGFRAAVKTAAQERERPGNCRTESTCYPTTMTGGNRTRRGPRQPVDKTGR